MIRTLIVSAALPFIAFSAGANEPASPLATCMIANTTPSQKAGMKQMIIHALQENKPAATESFLTLSFEAMSIATARCGATFADVQSPSFQGALEAYGQSLGEAVMKDALTFMDIPVD
jgi:hypothetical protein